MRVSYFLFASLCSVATCDAGWLDSVWSLEKGGTRALSSYIHPFAAAVSTFAPSKNLSRTDSPYQSLPFINNKQQITPLAFQPCSLPNCLSKTFLVQSIGSLIDQNLLEGEGQPDGKSECANGTFVDPSEPVFGWEASAAIKFNHQSLVQISKASLDLMDKGFFQQTGAANEAVRHERNLNTLGTAVLALACANDGDLMQSIRDGSMKKEEVDQFVVALRTKLLSSLNLSPVISSPAQCAAVITEIKNSLFPGAGVWKKQSFFTKALVCQHIEQVKDELVGHDFDRVEDTLAVEQNDLVQLAEGVRQHNASQPEGPYIGWFQKAPAFLVLTVKGEKMGRDQSLFPPQSADLLGLTPKWLEENKDSVPTGNSLCYMRRFAAGYLAVHRDMKGLDVHDLNPLIESELKRAAYDLGLPQDLNKLTAEEVQKIALHLYAKSFYQF